MITNPNSEGDRWEDEQPIDGIVANPNEGRDDNNDGIVDSIAANNDDESGAPTDDTTGRRLQ